MFKVLKQALLNEEMGEFDIGFDEIGLNSINEDDDYMMNVSPQRVLPSISDGDDYYENDYDEDDDELDNLSPNDLADDDLDDDEIEDRAIFHDMNEDYDDIDDDDELDSLSADDIDYDEDDDEGVSLSDDEDEIDDIDDPDADYPDNDQGLPNDVLDSELLTDSLSDIGSIGDGIYISDDDYDDIEEDTADDLESSIRGNDFNLFSNFDYDDDISEITTKRLGNSLYSSTRENPLFSDIEFPSF